MKCPKPLTLEAREKLSKYNEEKYGRDGYRGGRGGGGGRGGFGRGRGGEGGGSPGGAKREKEASCLALEFKNVSLVSLYSTGASDSVTSATSQEFPAAALDFDLCDGVGVELDSAWTDHSEYPTNTYSLALPSSGVDLNKETACLELFAVPVRPSSRPFNRPSKSRSRSGDKSVRVGSLSGASTPEYPTNTCHSATPLRGFDLYEDLVLTPSSLVATLAASEFVVDFPDVNVTP